MEVQYKEYNASVVCLYFAARLLHCLRAVVSNS